MQQGHQKTTIMVTNFDTQLHELGRMSYYSKGKELDLDELDENCIHWVSDLIMISGLSHLDARVQTGNKDYKVDPHTGAVEKNCPKCGYYLKEFLMHMIEKTGYIPTVQFASLPGRYVLLAKGRSQQCALDVNIPLLNLGQIW